MSAHRGALNAPWGLALRTPLWFGRSVEPCSSGNPGDGHINATARSEGLLAAAGRLCADTHGKPLVVNGLWGIAFGNDGLGGSRWTRFFFAFGAA